MGRGHAHSNEQGRKASFLFSQKEEEDERKTSALSRKLHERFGSSTSDSSTFPTTTTTLFEANLSHLRRQDDDHDSLGKVQLRRVPRRPADESLRAPLRPRFPPHLCLPRVDAIRKVSHLPQENAGSSSGSSLLLCKQRSKRASPDRHVACTCRRHDHHTSRS